jgi:hypothetical protein
MCCRRFFEKQRVDEIGYYSVRLQHVLIVLAIFNLLGIFLGGFANWFAVLVEFLLLGLAFYGAYKRNHRPLRAYVCINLTMIILSLVLVLFLVVFSTSHPEMADHTSPSPLEIHKPDNVANTNNSDIQNLQTPLTNLHAPQNATDIDNDEGDSEESYPTPAFFAIYLVAVVISALVFVLKIVSIVMALRLARMICGFQCRQLSHPISRSETIPSPAYQPMYPPTPQQPNMYQPMYVPVVINGQPNGQPQQFIYPNPYFVPQAMYTPMAPPAHSNDKPNA